MPKTKIDKSLVIERAIHMINITGIENLSLKTLAEDLGVKPPSLYNHVSGIDDLKEQIMLHGWKELDDRIVEAVIGLTGYDAVRAICRAFHEYAAENQGVFSAMLWYNQFKDAQNMEATSKMFSVFFKITESVNISRENCFHLVRMFRSFLEGFSLLENNHAFGNDLSVDDSFELALDVLVEGMKRLGSVKRK